ncbi:MAG: CHAT domain-containing protein, partial [Isosphaeraceae bacterium]
IDRYPDGHDANAVSLSNLGMVLLKQGRFAAGEETHRDALAMRRRLYPASRFPDGHPDVARSLNNLAAALDAQGRSAEAEPLQREVLEVLRRRRPSERSPQFVAQLARATNNLAMSLLNQGRPAAAEAPLREALALRRSLYPHERFPDGHPEIARSLNNVGLALAHQENDEESSRLCEEALAMCRRLYPVDQYPKGHPDLLVTLNNVGTGHNGQGRYDRAVPVFREALAMCGGFYPRDRFPNGHPDLSRAIHNLAFTLGTLGQGEEAEELYRRAVAMDRALYPASRYPAGHPSLARHLNGLAELLASQGDEEAEDAFSETMEICRSLINDYSRSRSDANVLNLMASLPSARDGYLSVVLGRRDVDPEVVYAKIWPTRSHASRLSERKHLAARAAAVSSTLRNSWEELGGLRRQHAESLLAPMPRDAESREHRDRQLQSLGDRINRLDQEIRAALPEIGQAEALAESTPAELRAALPEDHAFIDLLRFTQISYRRAAEGADGGRIVASRTPRYLGFVVTRKNMVLVDLNEAGPIEAAVEDWLRAISENKAEEPHRATLRDRVWTPLARHLPPTCSTVILAPDMALARIPWPALPGDRPGEVLLDRHALAVVPHGQFALQRLREAPSDAKGTGGILAVGGVHYDANDETNAPVKPSSTVVESFAMRGRSGLRWGTLPGSAREAERVAALAAAAGLRVERIQGADASSTNLLTRLPRVSIAHLATHGFFADPNFRSVLQIDPGLFERRGEERVGAGALSPLVLSGLVLSGANDPKTPGRGLVTGEALVDLDLSGLELTVLSACDTGLGDVAGGEGVFSLQKAFHLAGCGNVVASLWKVDDVATEALMGLFYRNLWVDRMPPLEALRRAQLHLYRNPDAIPVLAATRGVDFIERKLPVAPPRDPERAPGPVAPTSKWAAFLFSGIGR